MKKIAFILMIALACIFIASCVYDFIKYCPYCGGANVTKVEDGVYKCGKASCGKTFGAKGL